MPSDPVSRSCANSGAVRVASVSFLNARPLIQGLDEAGGIELSLDVPSRLLDRLASHSADVALLPVIDYQRLEGLRILTAGGIACDGPTLTVRIFSRIPAKQIKTLACDVDSHTSVALAKVVLAERYGIEPRLIEADFYGANEATADLPSDTAHLLIGDKVICEEPSHFPHQIDLGQAWKELTGLPFVFAAWMARSDVPLHGVFEKLQQAKEAGRRQIDSIIERFGIPRGWPAPIAKSYLTQYLQFDITPRHVEAIRLFHDLAFRHGMLRTPPRELVIES